MRLFGLMARNSGLNCSFAPMFTVCTRYGRPHSSSMTETLRPFGVLHVYKSIIAILSWKKNQGQSTIFPEFEQNNRGLSLISGSKSGGDRLFARLVEQRRDRGGRRGAARDVACIDCRGGREGFVDSCRVESGLRESCRLQQQAETLGPSERIGALEEVQEV